MRQDVVLVDVALFLKDTCVVIQPDPGVLVVINQPDLWPDKLRKPDSSRITKTYL